MQGSSFNGEKNQRLLSRFYGLYCQGERQRGCLTASLFAQSSGHHAVCAGFWMPIIMRASAHGQSGQRRQTEVLRVEAQALVLNVEKHSRMGPMNYLRDEFLEKSIAKSEAVEEQKLGGVQDEHSWICMPLMYYDDA